MSDREATWADSIPFSSPVPCTAWPPTCTKFLSQPRARVRVVQDSAEVASAAVARSLAAGSAEAGEAHSNVRSVLEAGTSALPQASTTFLLLIFLFASL